MKRSFILVLLFAVAMVVTSLLAGLFANFGDLLHGAAFDATLLPDSPNAFAAAKLICDALLVLLLFALRYIPFPLWRRRTGMPLCSVWRALLAVFLLAVGLSLLVGPWQTVDPLMERMFEAMAHAPLGILVLVVVGPLTEELVFREGILSALRSARYHALAAALISALLFAVVHGNLAQGIPAFGIGLLFAAFYIATNDIRLPLMGHLLNNALAVLILVIPGASDLESSMNPSLSVLLGSVLTLLGIAVAFSWWRTQRAASLKKIAESRR